MMDINGAKVVVIGLGASGRSACEFCLNRGASVLAVDDKAEDQFPKEIAEDLKNKGASLFLGGQPKDKLASADLIVISPGVPPSQALADAETAGVPIVSEVELASWFVEAPIIGITGTNGKSTVTGLIGEMLTQTGRPTFVGGNFGTPMIEAVGTKAAGPSGALVIELSSFQLERIERLKPAVSVLLNITEDHLDRYPSMDEYIAAKARIFLAQDSNDHAVVNGDDELCLSLANSSRAEVHRFGRTQGDVYETPDALVDGETSYPVSLLHLSGAHNRSNACAAILAARLAGADAEAIKKGLAAFRGLPHRMELVAKTDDGVAFFNDSKATNVGASVAALQGIEGGKVVLIAGGRDKGGDYGPLREQVEQKARAVVLIGEAADIIERAFAGSVTLERAKDLDEAVEKAANLAKSGDFVLFAPACSSFDMFKNYLERGETFRRSVANFLPQHPSLGDSFK